VCASSALRTAQLVKMALDVSNAQLDTSSPLLVVSVSDVLLTATHAHHSPVATTATQTHG
jgi:hypothetical protein